eukprot:jgi/Psemu1/287481/fgenesh1_pg.193_\
MFAGKFLSPRDCHASSFFGSHGSSDSSVEHERATASKNGFSDDENEFHDSRKRNPKQLSNDTSSVCSSHASSRSDYSRAYGVERLVSVDSVDSVDTIDTDEELGGLEGLLQMGCMDALFLPPKRKKKRKKPLVKPRHAVWQPDSREQAPQSKNSFMKEGNSVATLCEEMPNQIIIEHAHSFKDDSSLTIENAVAPDPPETAPGRVPKDDYSSISSEKEINSSMVTRGSMDSKSHDSTMPSPKMTEEIVLHKSFTPSPKKGGKVFERWKKANVQRLNSWQKTDISVEKVPSSGEIAPREEEGGKIHNIDTQNQHDQEATSGNGNGNDIAGDQDDASVRSDQATHSSVIKPFQQRAKLETRVDPDTADEELETYSAEPSSTNGLTKRGEAPFDEPDKPDEPEAPFQEPEAPFQEPDAPFQEPEAPFQEPHAPFDEPEPCVPRVAPMAFDSILSRRIENRRAAKSKVEEEPSMIHADQHTVSSSPNDSNVNDPPPQNEPEGVSEKSSFVSSPHSVGDGSGVATKIVTDNISVYPSLESSSLDKEDAENHAPSLLPAKGNNDFALPLEGKEQLTQEDYSQPQIRKPQKKIKNPFEDDDLYQEDGDDDNGGDDYLILATSSSDNCILQPIAESSIDSKSRTDSSIYGVADVSSPSTSSREAVPMIPSPRHSANAVVSPRIYGRTNPIIHRSSPRIYGRTQSRFFSNLSRTNGRNDGTESLNSRMASTTIKESPRGNPAEVYGTGVREIVSYFEANANIKEKVM